MMNLVEHAIRLVRAGRFDRGLAAYTRAMRNPFLRKEALSHRAVLLRAMGRYDDALRDYDEIVDKYPSDEAALLRADLIHSLGRTQEAVVVAMAALQQDPMNALAARLLVQWQEAAGKRPAEQEWQSHLDRNMPAAPLNPALATIESDPSSFPTSVFPEIGRLLYTLVRTSRPTLVIETGCYIGYSSICIAQALEENKHGHLHSFDLFPENPDYTSPIIGRCSDLLHAARAHIEHAGLAHRITLHKGDAAAEIPRAFPQGERNIQMAFIDADHTLAGAYSDWREVDRILADGAVVVLHDTATRDSEWIGPAALVAHLQRTRGFQYQAISLPSRQGQGIGIVQKLSSSRQRDWRPSLVDLWAEWFWDNRWRRKFFRYDAE